MRLKCDRCGRITDYEFPTSEIQLDADYFSAAVERIKRETAQLTLGI